ncbi:hypothetical protein SDC9_136996 [bioreactor metagenome]|uniref:Uncharacterized protein n=1 Tax=bioreactor metagenome TaxID=1076179 RepID=A0A645DKV5_9ZZZZ
MVSKGKHEREHAPFYAHVGEGHRPEEHIPKRIILQPRMIQLVMRQRQHAVNVIESPKRLAKRHLIGDHPFRGGALTRAFGMLALI